MPHKTDDEPSNLDAALRDQNNCYPFPESAIRESSAIEYTESPATLADDSSSAGSGEVISFFTSKQLKQERCHQVVGLVPETSGIKMVYRNSPFDERYIAVPVLCWGITSDGDIIGLVPWVSELLDCETIADKFDVYWEGYYASESDEIFVEPPVLVQDLLKLHSRHSMQTTRRADATSIILEFNDPIGTHAMLVNPEADSIVLTAVVSWRLMGNGQIECRIADEGKPYKYPILSGDDCLYTATDNPDFRCFFQREIAEQIRNRDPETMDAIERLFVG